MGCASDPQRGGPGGDEGVTLAGTPPEPQPEADWRDAFIRYVEDLPEEALDEIVSLYRTGGGGGGKGQTWRRVRRAPMPPISTGLSS